MKYYFEHIGSPICYTFDYFIDLMHERDIDEMEVYEAIRLIKSEFFYCSHFYFVGEKGEDICGKFCKEYKPRNGKSGICKHNRSAYGFGEKVTIRR